MPPVFARAPAFALGVAVSAVAPSLLAETGVRLSVQRGTGAEVCPDGPALENQVARVRGPAASSVDRLAYSVSFARSESAFHATIRSENDASERSLSDPSETCDSLARATAVTLALLIDAEPDVAERVDTQESSSNSTPAADSTRHVRVAVPLRHEETSEREPRTVGVHAGAALLSGVIRPLAPAVSAGAGLGVRAFRATVGALWALPDDVALGPGQVTTSLFGATLEGCFAPLRLRPARFELCSGLIGALLRAEASGYTDNEVRTRPWLALPLALAVTTESRPIAWQAGGALLVPLRPQTFRVDGLGTIYDSPAVGGLLWIRGIGLIPW